jgi:hypothetical protein
MTAEGQHWTAANQRHLMAALAVVRGYLERHAQRGTAVEVVASPAAAEWRESSPPALDILCSLFGLSPFERDVVVLCAGIELDGSLAGLCAAGQIDTRRTHPTFGLALAAFPHAHWDALAPASPLRRWRLIDVLPNNEALTTSVLRIDERILHFLTGVQSLDERLRALIERVTVRAQMPLSQLEPARQIVRAWHREPDDGQCPIVFLGGNDALGKRAVAAAACEQIDALLYALRGTDVPAAAAEREALARLWEREALLQPSALLLDLEDQEVTPAVRAFIESLRGSEGRGDARDLLLISGQEWSRSARRPLLRLEVAKPTVAEQRALWQQALGPLAAQLNGQLEPLIAQFDLDAPGIEAAGLQSRRTLQMGETLPSRALWDICRIQARSRLDDLAQRIESAASWHDLVLPETQLRTLQDVAVHLRQRGKVYDSWGFAAKGTRGLGISALFAGGSGTGKTMAAEVLASELHLDLYRIDLSQVVSKYIGETEKNLRRVFDAAEAGGAVLLFDEADALFGKRSEVKDSHDRYANIEVSYLLQRMEQYRGLAILTTNLKGALDPAFLRRLRFVVQFPFPDAVQRAEIWRRVFPSQTPTRELEMTKLARLNVAGGNIRNIALQAAFLAADDGEPVTMAHLLRAARHEYSKLEKPLTDTEIGGW